MVYIVVFNHHESKYMHAIDIGQMPKIILRMHDTVVRIVQRAPYIVRNYECIYIYV